tara:strand:+ start:9548 stop:13810 length:4263 start_codon:yes stop_codon:yes gene_type:complete
MVETTYTQTAGMDGVTSVDNVEESTPIEGIEYTQTAGMSGAAVSENVTALAQQAVVSAAAAAADAVQTGLDAQATSADQASTAQDVIDSAASASAAAASASGSLLKASNLSDLANAGTSRANLGVAIGSNVQAFSSVLANTTASFLASDKLKLDNVEAGANVTNTASVLSSGALMDSELASIADVKGLDQSVVSGAAPVFSVGNMTLDNTNLVVASSNNLQDFADRTDAAILRARGTGVSSTYVSTVAVGGTTFAQPAVSGEIESDQGYFEINYAGATGITVATLSSDSTYVYIDNTGALQQQSTYPTRQDWSRKMFTMRIAVDTNTSLIVGFEYYNNPIGHYANSIRDLYTFLLAQGMPFKQNQTITGRPSDLGFDVSAGTIMEFGGTGDINNANILSLDAVANASFFLAQSTTFDAGGNTSLPKFWDNNGTLVALGSTTVVGHRLYRYSNGNFVMQYGQANYANIVLARAGVLLERYNLNPVLENATFFGWWLIQETATNTGGTTLTDFRQYTIGVQGGTSSSLAGALLQGNNLSDLLDAASSRSNIGVEIGVDVQAFSSVLANTTASFLTAEKTKLAGIEAAADVTDTANVTASGALMDSEVANLAQVKAFSSAAYATAAQGSLADSALQDSDIGASVQAYAAVLANTTASFLTAEKTKLSGIESGATADQTSAQIKTSYESNADTQAFTDADHAKLDKAGETFATRAAAVAATITAATTRIFVFTADGDTISFKRDALGTALATAGSQTWSPDGMATPQHFGAEPSIANNTAALNAWAQYITRGSANTATGGNDGGGTGTFRHTGQIIFPICEDLKIEGNRLELKYTGTSTTLDPIWRMGASNGESRRWRIANLKVTSDTTMTAGEGLLAERVMTSSFRDVTIDGQHGTGKLWNGIWIKDCGTFFWDGFDCRSQNENMVVSGSVGKGQAEYRFENGRSLLGDIGFHIAGGVGGVYLGGDFIQNRENLRVSTERSAVINREIFVQSDAAFDSTTAGGYSVNVVDTLTQQGGWLNFASPWIASGDAAALRIGPNVAMRIILNGGNVFNAGAVHAGTGHNILCESALVRLTLTGTLIRDARGTGINFTVANPYYQAHDVYFTGNATDFNANGRPQSTIAVDGKTFNAQLRMGAYGTEGGEIRFNDAAGALGGTIDVTSAGGDFRFRNSKTDGNTASVVLSQTNDIVFNGNMGMGVKPINALRALPYSFAIGDADTGIGQNGDGILEFFANNAYRLRIESTSVSVQPNLRCLSSLEVAGSIFGESNDGITAIFGGTAGNGANIELFGGSHPTQANNTFFDSDTVFFRAAAGGTVGLLLQHLAATPAATLAMQLNLGQVGGEGGELRFQNASNASYDYVIDVSGTDLFRIRRGAKIFMSMDAAGYMKFDRPTYADNAAAASGGVPVGADYRTSTGEVRVRV